jgi:hypothetical protein
MRWLSNCLGQPAAVDYITNPPLFAEGKNPSEKPLDHSAGIFHDPERLQVTQTSPPRNIAPDR